MYDRETERRLRILERALDLDEPKSTRDRLLRDYFRRMRKVTDRGGIWGAIPPISEFF